MDDVIHALMNLPPFTRTWLGASVAITTAYTFDVIKFHQLFLDWDQIFLKRSESYRIITCFCTCDGGKMNQFPTLFLLYTMYLHSKGYESNPFKSNSGSFFVDTVFAAIICGMLLLLTHIIINTYFEDTNYALYPILTRNLVSSFTYLWSKKNPNAIIQLNFIPIKGAYLPLAHIALSLLLKNRVYEMIHGFVIGHVYYFLIHVVPLTLGFRIISAPRILTHLLGHDVEYEVEMHHPSPPLNSIEHFQQRDGATDAHVYAKTGNVEALQNLASTSDNPRSLFMGSDRNGWQPIHEAIRGDYIDIVQFLLIDQQVDVFATTRTGDTPISLSRQFCGEDDHHPITQLILQAMEEQR